MMRIRKILILLVLIVTLSFLTAFGAKVVAVFPFKAESYGSRKIASGMGNLLENYIVDLGVFKVVERSELNKVVQEYKLGLAGMLKPETAKEIGNLLGADYLIFGRVEATKYDSSGDLEYLLVTARIVDVKSGEIKYSVRDEIRRLPGAVNLTTSDLMRKATQDLAFKIASRVTGRTLVLPMSLRWESYGPVFFGGAALAALSLPPFEGIWVYTLNSYDESTIKAYMTLGMVVGIGTAGYAFYKIYISPDIYRPNELLGNAVINYNDGWIFSMPEILGKDDILEARILDCRF